MKKIIVSMCAITIAAGVLPTTTRQAQAGLWGKVAAGAVALAAGYYFGRRSNPPGTTYIIQSPQYSYDGGGSGGGGSSDSALASYLAERDRKAELQAEQNASRAPQRIFDKPDWRPTELKILAGNRPRIKELQRQIHEKVVEVEREMTPKNRWACFAICGRFGVGEAYGASMTVDGEAMVTTGVDQAEALNHLNDQCGAKYKAYHLFMDLDPDYLIMDAKVGEICGPLKPSKEACSNSIPAAIANEWTNTKTTADSLGSSYDSRRRAARPTLLRLANRLHELFLDAQGSRDFTSAKDWQGRANALYKISATNASMFNYRNCDLGRMPERDDESENMLCRLDRGGEQSSYLPLAGDLLTTNSWGDITVCAAENAPGTPSEKRIAACASLKADQLLSNNVLSAIDATGDKSLIEDGIYNDQLPVQFKVFNQGYVDDWSPNDYLFAEKGGDAKFHRQLSDSQSYVKKNPTEEAALDNGLIEMGCKPARQKHAELELPGTEGGSSVKNPGSGPELDFGSGRDKGGSSQNRAS